MPLETPSRVWRRIEAADELAVPSLPSLPAIDNLDDDEEDEGEQSPKQTTLSLSARKPRTTATATTVRFAEKHESFEFSDILPIKHHSLLTDEDDGEKLPVDYSITINPQVSSLSQDLNKHVAQRNTRTPSLTRSASLVSTPPNSTPTLDEQLSLPNASGRSSSLLHQPPSVRELDSDKQQESSTRNSPLVSRTGSHSGAEPTQPEHRQQSLHIPPHTPQTTKRSFMLDVIHSAAKPRPRLSMRTPAPAQPTQHPSAFRTPLCFRTPKQAGNDSFISTASSHDLAIHQPHVNASFDHLTGAKGVGRFNATKLNTYLHGLNRRLVEENEELVKRLDALNRPTSTILEADESTRALEIAALEDMVKDLEAELAKEREEKEKERLNFERRVKEVEEGVEGVVDQLERQLEAVEEAKEQAVIKARRAQDLKGDAEERANRAEIALAKLTKSTVSPRRSQALSSPAGSGTVGTDHEDFKEALERVAELEAELRLTFTRCRGLEEELKSADEALEELRSDKQASDRKLLAVNKKLEKSVAELEQQEKKAQELQEELKDSQQAMESLMAELGDAHEDVAAAKEELENAKGDIEVLREQVLSLESRCERFEREARQMEEALEAGETQMMQDQEELASLRGEVERLRLIVSTGAPAFSSNRASTNTAVSIHDQSTGGPSSNNQEEIDALEKELDDAHREIGRLQHLLRDSPTRAALAQAKDNKIDALEKENAELEERIRTLRVLLSKGPLPGNAGVLVLGTPNRSTAFNPGASPATRPLLSFRGPKTPGGPLKDASWLQSANGLDESHYLRQISLLERELAHANENVDDKIDKLEEYGRGVVGLTDKLADAETRINFLDGEVKRLQRREERRMLKARKGTSCSVCGSGVELMTVLGSGDQTSIDMSHATPIDIANSESMRTMLARLTQMKQDWEHEKMRLEGERNYLQSAVDQLHQVDRAGHGSGNAREGLSELDQARRAIAEFEVQLQLERDRLRAITNERNRTINEKNDILSNLERTRTDMDAVKDQLRKCKQENYALEADLRSNAIAESNCRHLQAKVAQNQTLIDQLRRERDQLAESHTALQHRYTSASERVEGLRKTLSETQNSHDERRHQLDMQIAEIDDLKRELAWRDEELEQERRRRGKDNDLTATVEALDKEVRRIRSNAESFAHDMNTLRENNSDLELQRREEAAKAERIQMQLRTQVKLLDEQLEGQRGRIRQLADELRHHVCVPGNEVVVANLKSQHREECKGLMIQINYLKGRCTRENTFRQELAYQKQYLLLVLSRLRDSNIPILAAIARDGDLSISGPAPSKRSIKRVVHIVMFLNRAKKAAKQWAAHSEVKGQLAVALQDVRRRRAASSDKKGAPGLAGIGADLIY